MSADTSALLAATLVPSASDSARVVAQAYSISLAALVPFIAAGVASFALRRATPRTQVLVWRGAIIALAIIVAGQLAPFRGRTAAVPQLLASPLILLGQLQLAVSSPGDVFLSRANDLSVMGIRILALVIGIGIAGAALRLLVASFAASRLVRRSRRVHEAAWTRALTEAKDALSIARPVRMAVADVSVATVCGVFRPTILLPRQALQLAGEQRRALLLHELAHVRSSDLVFVALARTLQAVLWFHPVAHCIARRLRESTERAADDRVLESGVRASEYASLLLHAQSLARRERCRPAAALALDGGGGLRGRLTAIVDTTRDLRGPRKGVTALAMSLSVVVALPTATTRPAPTRAVLTSLLHASQWESRAYAVIGLAQRADTVDVARAAAERDPSPRVRAWGLAALAGAPIDSTRVPSTRPTLPHAHRAG